MTELLLLRHAHAGDPTTWTKSDDIRPLSKKGRDQAARMAAFLLTADVRPDVIVASPRARAVQTAEPVADALGLEVRIDARLADPFGVAEAEAMLVDLGDPERPMLVGHDPDFSTLLGYLIDAAGIGMRKGALATVDLPTKLGDGDATLRWLLPPDLLEG